MKQIFGDNNNRDTFCPNTTNILRTVEIEEVNKMIYCKTRVAITLHINVGAVVNSKTSVSDSTVVSAH
ncbi:MAG: hypothetical protein ACT6FC_02845 [Methanosarcinaceae archaeon]